MTADQTPENTAGYTEATVEDLEEGRKGRRSLWNLLPVIAVIAIVIIVLLMLRDCAGDGGSDQAARKTIESVDGFTPVAGAVSIWVTDGTDPDTVLSAAGVESSGRMDMGGGRYVITVPAGTEEQAAAALSKASGVNDAGRVYEK